MGVDWQDERAFRREWERLSDEFQPGCSIGRPHNQILVGIRIEKIEDSTACFLRIVF